MANHHKQNNDLISRGFARRGLFLKAQPQNGEHVYNDSDPNVIELGVHPKDPSLVKCPAQSEHIHHSLLSSIYYSIHNLLYYYSIRLNVLNYQSDWEGVTANLFRANGEVFLAKNIQDNSVQVIKRLVMRDISNKER